jgi:hypothetical protein
MLWPKSANKKPIQIHQITNNHQNQKPKNNLSTKYNKPNQPNTITLVKNKEQISIKNKLIDIFIHLSQIPLINNIINIFKDHNH